jgi:acetate kinase
MEHIILTANIGSASKKYTLFAGDARLLDVHLEHDGAGYIATIISPTGTSEEKITQEQFNQAAAFVLNHVKNQPSLTAIGIRVVAPGGYFTHHRIVDDEYVSKLSQAQEFAPLHITATLAEIHELKKLFPAVPLIAASDSAFHTSIPEIAKRYALPESLVKTYELVRYGYHGLSVSSVINKLATLPGGIPSRTVICHLGSGSSITALLNGSSVDTSMGFSPLEGLPMTTRSGSVDPGVIILLTEKLDLTPRELEKKLNSESGLLGISELSADIRELIKAEESGNEKAKLALDIFAYHTRKYIGSYVAALGGIDALIFTGTIGERSAIMRERITSGLEYLKIKIASRTNNKILGGVDALISKTSWTDIMRRKGRIAVHVLAADEAKMIADVTHSLI